LEIQTEHGLDDGAPGEEDSEEDAGSETNESDDDNESDDEISGEEKEDGVREMQAVEDEHLNLDDMEAFLQEAEDIQARENDPERGDSSDEEALDALLDDMMNTKSGKTSGKRLSDAVDHSSDPLSNAKYEDFFGPRKSSKKAVRFANDTEKDDDKGTSDTDEQESESDSDDDGDDFHDDQFEYDQESDQDEDDIMPSRHQMRLEKVSSKIHKLEEEALGEKDWFMKGEGSASHRPKNSALEIDLDFETTMKPPPQPTEETTKSLEDIIKRRIADHKFDDVIAIVPTTEERKKTTVELDDVKSSQGLGEIYENEYLSARMGGTSEDKDEPIRELAKKQFIALCAKLDQLSHGQYKPVPSIEDVTFKVDVPAIMMEEATPAFVSEASMRKPEEVYKLGQSLKKSVAVEDEEGEEKIVTTREGMMQAEGVAKSEAELTREDRKRRRAAKKRAAKKRKMSRDAEQMQRAVAAGKTAIPGRKSEEARQMLRKLSSSANSTGTSGTNFTKSREVFARMNELRQQHNNPPAAKAKSDNVRSRHLKL
jgi:U3 small nucleolar RNA-associated protein MPP10